MDRQELVFDLSELQVGSPLRFDIFHLDGQVLAREGDIVSRDMIRQWATEGIHQAKLASDAESFADAGMDSVASREEQATQVVVAAKDKERLRPYDEQLLKKLAETYTAASERLLSLLKVLGDDEFADCGPLAETVQAFSEAIEMDIAAVLSTLYPDPDSEEDKLYADRSARMGVLASAVGKTLDWSQQDCLDIGMAGMLHDVALFPSAQAAVRAAYGMHRDDAPAYLDHPLQAATLLTHVEGVPGPVRHIITQVHESPDGLGFPRGLPGERIHRAARVLNVVDAFLTLSATHQPPPMPSGGNLVPADALAYMLHHARHGSFDIPSVRGLVEALSVYPIGTAVALDNEQMAIVLRSNGGDAPTQPIVRIDGPERQIVDLRTADISIVGPAPDSEDGRIRLRTAQLSEVLWVDDNE